MTTVDTREDFPALRAMVQHLSAQATLNEGLSGEGKDAFVMSVMEGILTAESIDDIFAAQDAGGMLSGKDFVNRPFTIAGLDAIEWRKSSQVNVDGGGFPLYAILQVTPLDTGEETTINCGGKTFVATLQALINKDYFDEPRTLMITAVQSGDNAYLQLRPFKLPEPARAKSK